MGHNLDVINVYIQGHSHQLRARDPVTFGFSVQLFDQRLGHMDKNGPHRLRHKWVIPRKLLGNIYSSERSTGLRTWIAAIRAEPGGISASYDLATSRQARTLSAHIASDAQVRLDVYDIVR
jgi:hypothetical protein